MIFLLAQKFRMALLTKEEIKKFICQNNLEFSATQKNISMPILIRIYKKMKGGIRFADIRIKEGLICDGHHRYIASLLANCNIQKVAGEIPNSVVVIPWSEVTLHETDFDTAEKVQLLNSQDADFNNMSLEEVVELLK